MSDTIATTASAPAAAEYPDDGHIFVCVRVRDVPQNIACLTNANGTTSAASSTRASTVARKSVLRDANRICVSVVENIVVMHDPKSVEDAATVAKDGNNVVQLLTDRAAQANGPRPSRRTAAAAVAPAASRTSSRRTLHGGAAGAAHLVPTGTANYYECDHCIASMDEAQLMQMPLIRTSDFLQPPSYGTQEEVYRRTAMHAVKAAVDGINSCVFAYGQTGSGKTYTLFGDTANMRRDPGVVPRTLDDLFSRLESVKQTYKSDAVTDYSYNVQLSFYEIYQNEVYCLFSRQGPLHVQFVRDATGKKETMIIHDLQQQAVTSAEKAYPMIEMGLRRRQTAETGMNARSSRSHAVLQIRVTQYRMNRETRETVEHQATVNLVDLAGSERQKTANTSGTSRAEGIQINQSLATLARVINDIASGAKFVNYRDSLLTMVLKDNLGGNSKTFMIANISPIAFSYQESCATLTYAKDVRKIRNRPTVNRTFQTRANLVEQNMLLKQENEKLKEQMEAWVRSLQHGGGVDSCGAVADLGGLSPVHGVSQTVFLSPMKAPSPPVSAERLRAANASLVGAGTAMCGNEVFLSATSNGLTAPLLVASHRRYTSVAGIGGSCVEGGVVRVSALVQATMEFPLARVLHPPPATAKTRGRRAVSMCAAEAEADGTRSPDECPSGGVTRRPTVAAHTDAADAVEEHDADADADLGALVLERVAQRSCEQRYYVHFRPPTTAAEQARLIDVQVNGKSVGAKGRRELHHGDVVCAYLEDAAVSGAETSAVGLRAQSLISFHYVDLTALSRNASAAAGGLDSATLGQIAVSVDLPADMENLTLEGIKQLQRDNAKLLDMVRQQAETIDYQCARASAALMAHENLLEGISPIGSPGSSESPNPRSLEASSSLSPATPLLADTRKVAVVLEAFRRLSVSPSIRGGSVMPADVSADDMLRRAAAQSESQQRLDSAVRENEKLHRTAATRNATLDALARRLAELESGGLLTSAAAAHRSSSSSSSSSTSVSISQSAEHDEKGATKAGVTDIDADLNDVSARSASQRGGSVTCVSSPSQARGASAQRRDAPATDKRGDGDADEEEDEAERIGDGKRRIVFENTEGARERYQAVVREREQFDRILELEEIIRDLRDRLGELESRLRFAKDDTLEQQMLCDQAEAERDALLEELANTRSEIAALQRDNASLQGFLAKDEQALADAARLADEELERQTSVLSDRLAALKAIARLWKQRTMKYIAMGYGAGTGPGDATRLDTIPWNDLRAAETVAIAKRRLGHGDADACPAVMAQTVDEFEAATAEENLRALEYALLAFEQENQRLLGEIRRIQGELDGYKDLVHRLRSEKAQMERALADASDATEEERRRLQQQLHGTNTQLEEAETNLRETQSRLDEAVALCDTNKRKAVKNNELLLAQQKKAIEDLEAELERLRRDYACKDEELANLTRYMQDRDAMAGSDGVSKSFELRSRIEELVNDSMEDYEAPNGYSMFPSGFEFSDEMVALIRICLRILMDRLKMELYVLNAQSVHKFQLLIHAVKARTEAHFHTFMHQLRDAVSQMSGRTVRPGGKWGLSESDVLSTLVDHRRRQVGDALNGLLIWYDHWDSAPKTEHVAYMELIRNADRIMQMARLVRRESVLNTNATSTSLMPIPGKKGTSDTSLIADAARRTDKTVKSSSKILSRLASSTRQSNLARAVTQFSATPSRPTISGRDEASASALPHGGGAPEREGATPFTRSATVTALALSQSLIPFSRTATGTRAGGGGGGHPAAPLHRAPSSVGILTAAPAANTENCPPFTRCPSTLPRPSVPAGASASPATVHVASMTVPVQPHAATATPVRPTKPTAAGAPAAAAARANYARMASAGVLPVSDADVDYVANTDVVEAVSISRYNFSRRMSTVGALADGNVEKTESMRRPSRLFSRCQTTAVVPVARGSAHQPPPPQGPLHRQASAISAATNAAPATKPSTAQAFARSKTHHTIPTSALAARQSGRRSGLRGSTGSSTRSSVVADGAGFSRARLSAFPCSTAGAAPATSGSRPLSVHALGKPAGGAEPTPTPFYNPDVIRSLRERSTSDANRSAALDGGAKLGGAAAVASHKKKSGTSSSGSAAAAPAKKKSAAPATSAFHKTSTDARGSGGGPIVPKMNFSHLANVQ